MRPKRMAYSLARRTGSIEGLLYAGGVIQAGMGRPHPRCLLQRDPRSSWTRVCRHPDGMPPRFDNLRYDRADQDYAEGIFIVNAHVLWKAGRSGRALPFKPAARGAAVAWGTGFQCSLAPGVLYTSQVMCDLPGISKSTVGWRRKGAIMGKRPMGLECWRFGTTTIFVKGLSRVASGICCTWQLAD